MTGDPPTPPDPPAAVRVTAAKCVRCGNPVTPRSRPFCSQRCADIDLGSWFTERYRLAGGQAPGEDRGEDENS